MAGESGSIESPMAGILLKSVAIMPCTGRLGMFCDADKKIAWPGALRG
jgi:hypothetical protein